MPERRIENVLDVVDAEPGVREAELAVDNDITHYSVVFPFTEGVEATPERTVDVRLWIQYGREWVKGGGCQYQDGDTFHERFGQRMVWATATFTVPRRGIPTRLRVVVDSKHPMRLQCHVDYLIRESARDSPRPAGRRG